MSSSELPAFAADGSHGLTAAVTKESSPTGTTASTTMGDKKQLMRLQRAERLKNPKIRQMGIDREALDAQVREKEAQRRAEKEREAYYDRQALLMDKHACALQKQVNQVRRDREKEMQQFRATHQGNSTRREWDLNDPAMRAKELPARVGDEDPRNGPSGMQKFEGEDLDYTARRAAQQAQQHAWATQQVEEKLAKKWMDSEANRLYDERAEENNQRAHLIERSMADQRHERARNTAAFNKAMHEQTNMDAARAREEGTRQGLEEISYQMSSDFLNEREPPQQSAASAQSEKSHAKGMTKEQLARLHAEQKTQLEQLQRRRLMDVEEAKQWAQQENMQLRMAQALDRQRNAERKEQMKSLANTHKEQMDAAVKRREEMKTLYSNQVDEDYYKHWDKCL